MYVCMYVCMYVSLKGFVPDELLAEGCRGLHKRCAACNELLMQSTEKLDAVVSVHVCTLHYVQCHTLPLCPMPHPPNVTLSVQCHTLPLCPMSHPLSLSNATPHSLSNTTPSLSHPPSLSNATPLSVQFSFQEVPSSETMIRSKRKTAIRRIQVSQCCLAIVTCVDM